MKEMDLRIKDRIEKGIRNLDTMQIDISLSVEQLSELYNKNDYREMLIMILLKRALRFLRAFIILSRNDLGEPAMAVVRSILEADLLIRWCLADGENVRKYLKEGLSGAYKVIKNLMDKDYYKGDKQKELVDAFEKMKNYDMNYTQWKKIANITGMNEIFDLTYPVLSAMAHGSLMSVSGQIENKDISKDSDPILIDASIPLANTFSSDCRALVAEWIYTKRIIAVPNLLECFN